MLFSSYPFLFGFLPVAYLGYALLGRCESRQPSLVWLLLCSLFFYAYWNPWYVLLLMASMGANFAVGRGLEHFEGRSAIRRALLWFGVSGNLALLGYYKYANFFVDTVRAAGVDWSLSEIALPLGISFFTFQQVGYVVDRWRGEKLSYTLVEYCLFVTFFPQLIAGPIVDHRSLFPQFADRNALRLQAENMAVGITIFLMGLFKKIILAERAAEFAGYMFNAAGPLTPPTFAEAWLGTLCYTMQLYFDFSGYSDMAIGLGRIFGMQIPLNFNSPYKATSIIEFWRRWHMTLSAFLRDHLYVPLGGSRCGSWRRYLNLFVTMLLGGLWHGAGWTFVLWGSLHGAFLMVNHGWVALRKRCGWQTERDPLAWRLTAGVLTFMAVMVGWVFFRARDFETGRVVLESLCGLQGLDLTTHFKWNKATMLLVVLGVIVWGCPNTQQLMAHFRPAYDWDRVSRHIAPLPRGWNWLAWRPTVWWAFVFIGVSVTILVNMGKAQEFLYFQF